MELCTKDFTPPRLALDLLSQMSEDGRYYYNSVTGCSVWEDPCERWRYDVHVGHRESIDR